MPRPTVTRETDWLLGTERPVGRSSWKLDVEQPCNSGESVKSGSFHRAIRDVRPLEPVSFAKVNGSRSKRVRSILNARTEIVSDEMSAVETRIAYAVAEGGKASPASRDPHSPRARFWTGHAWEYFHSRFKGVLPLTHRSHHCPS